MRTGIWVRFAGASLLAMLLTGGTAALAQDQAAEATPEEALLSAADLDRLMAPVALYPDTLLSQIMLASTYPLDVVKAARFVEDNAETPDKDRAALAEKTPWDPSVQALAAGFPTIVTRMNDNLDWTEQLGEAVLVQTDDVLDAVQRLRDQAADTGYLTSNDAQTVTVTDNDTITIAPTNPQVVYVPAYDSSVVYTQPAPADVVYVNDGSGDDFADVLATGAIVFGTALLLDEVFDDDDPWDDYWRGPPRVDWDNGDFDGRPDVNVDGDVNIGSGNTINRIDRDSVKIDRDNLNIDRDNVNIDRDGAAREKIGSLDRDQIDRTRDRSFNPDAARQAEARDKIAARKSSGGEVPSLSSLSGSGDRLKGQAGTAAAKPRPAAVNRPVAVDRPARVERPAAVQRPANVARPAATKHPQAANRAAAAKASHGGSAFERSGGSRAKAASQRGKVSAGKRRG